MSYITIESPYLQDQRGFWKRSHSNFLADQVEGGSFTTVRWEEPMQQSKHYNRTLQVAA